MHVLGVIAAVTAADIFDVGFAAVMSLDMYNGVMSAEMTASLPPD